MDNFYYCYKSGNRVERQVASDLSTRGYKVLTTEDKGYFPGYDMTIECPEGYIFKAEVKNDEQADEKKRIYVEVRKSEISKMGTRDGGLSATKADIYLQTIKYQPGVWAIEVEKLKKLVEEKSYLFETKFSGDGNSEGVVFDEAFFKSQCLHLYDRLPEAKLVTPSALAAIKELLRK